MTMAKKLPIRHPSIHTFEIRGKYTDYRAKGILFKTIRELVDRKKYYKVNRKKHDKNEDDDIPDGYYIYKRAGGGLTIILSEFPKYSVNYIRLSGVNLARIAGKPSRLTLTDLSMDGLAAQEKAFLDELSQLGILEVEQMIEWKINRLDITQDFYVKTDTSLLMKAVRYAGVVFPYRTGQENHHDMHNEIRSCRYERVDYDFELYDKHQQLLTSRKEEYYIREEDLELSQNMVRYEIQLNRPYLRKFEAANFPEWDFQFKEHFLFFYFQKIGELIPSILYNRAIDMFGRHPWYSASEALKRVEKSDLNPQTKALVTDYIERVGIAEAETTDQYSERQKRKIKEALNVLEINEVILPDNRLNKRQKNRVPCASLCSKVQDVDEFAKKLRFGAFL